MTQAPCSTPTPTLTLFTYTLVEGSSLATGQGGPEPLTGTFTVFENPEYIPNTLFDYRIRAVDFQAGALTIRGGSPPLPPPGELPYSGWLSAVTFDPRPHQIYANMWLLIDDEPVALGGGGYMDSPILPPAFHGLELCGLPANRAVSCDQIRSGAESGYILTLSAVPVASLPTPTPTVDCFENVGGCCDFRGQKPCYTLVYGADAAQCLNRDSGSARGCHGSVTCNLTTGLCEDQAF